MIERLLFDTLKKKMGTGKALVIIGPRQVGKTTLILKLLDNKNHLFLNGDDGAVVKLLSNANTEDLRGIVGNHKLVFIDEAQRIPNIGLSCKIIHDQFKDVQLIISGSSAFELTSQTSEPLTGRKWEYELFPISWMELQDDLGYLKAEQQLEHRMIYGFYPDVINNFGQEREILFQLVNSYLYKDILSYSGIRKPEILEKLTQALAFQVGHEVNYNKLSQLLQIDKNTVSNYVDLLEQAYVVFKLPSFSKNLRNEIKTNQKIYFYDNGVRNTAIGNLNPLAVRNDRGALWENFLMSERLKHNTYAQSFAQSYFWRTKQQQEIDYIEEDASVLTAFEFKWNPSAKVKFSKTFTETYSAQVEVVNRDNFRNFLK